MIFSQHSCNLIESCQFRVRVHLIFYLAVLVLVMSLFVSGTRAWDPEEMDLFDLVEEVNQ